MRTLVITMILGSMLSWTSAMFAEESTVLKDVRTSVQGGHTRVAFQFSGDVRFSTEPIANGVRIVFTKTRAATPGALSRQVLNAGPLESVGFQRPAIDDLVAVLAFAPGSTYRCMCPASGNELYVDVRGSAAARVVVAPKPAPVRTAPAQAAVVPPAADGATGRTAGSALIDIPAVAKHQMDGEGSESGTRGRTAGDAGALSFPLLVLVSVAVSLAVTAVALVVIVRMLRTVPEPVAATVPVATVPPAPPEKVKAYQQYRVAMEADDDDMKPEPERIRELFGAPAREEEVEEDAGRETSLQLARSFRRGSEEITLARKFHERPSPALTPAKMQTAMARATTKTQRLTAARKLGVGRGEFDLAEKLKTMSQPPAKNEEGQA